MQDDLSTLPKIIPFPWANSERPMEDAERERYYTAFHEAGHAVVAVCLGIPVRDTDIRPRVVDGGEKLGRTWIPVPTLHEVIDDTKLPRKHIMYVLAGLAAEARVNHEADGRGAGSDFEAIKNLCQLANACGDLEAQNTTQLIESCLCTVEDILGKQWAKIERVAALLLEREFLTGDDVAAIVHEQ